MRNASALAKTAKREARKCYHGAIMGMQSTIKEMVAFFPKWTEEEADGNWCAAFVYFCCVRAGMKISIRPKECASCNLAGCGAWEEWAMGDERLQYHSSTDVAFAPKAGDIVLFDRVFCDREHDHIGIVVENKAKSIMVAEGNINNVSGVVERKKDAHIRGYISIPDRFSYS